jgi:hypothetical protein
VSGRPKGDGPFDRALSSSARKTPGKWTEAEKLADFCEHLLPIMAGAVGPELVWEGAMREGLALRDLMRICAGRDMRRLDDLMFGP